MRPGPMDAGIANHLDGSVRGGSLVKYTHMVHNVAFDSDGREARVVGALDLQPSQCSVFIVAIPSIMLVMENVVVI
jgi:hypothetical protein